MWCSQRRSHWVTARPGNDLMGLERGTYVEGSWVVAWIRRWSARLASIAQRLSRPVVTRIWVAECLSTLRAAPLRAVGLVVVTSVLTYMGCLWVLGKDGNVLGGVMCVLLVLGLKSCVQAVDPRGFFRLLPPVAIAILKSVGWAPAFVGFLAIASNIMGVAMRIFRLNDRMTFRHHAR